MLEKVLAKRYAGALLGLAKKEDLVDRIEKELTGFLTLYRQLPDLARILNHPLVGQAKKKALLNKAISDQANPIIMRFVELLIRKGRISYLPEIATAYHKLADEWRGVVRVTVRSFSSLSTEQLNTLEQKLHNRLIGAKKIIFEPIIDQSLLGGLTVQVGDEVIDGSVAGHLNRLQQSRNSYYNSILPGSNLRNDS